MARSPAACCTRSKMARWSFSVPSRSSTAPSGRICRSKRVNTASASSMAPTRASTASCCSMRAGRRCITSSSSLAPMVACLGSPWTCQPMVSHLRLPHPEVMEFRVSAQPVEDPFVLPEVLSPSYRRLAHDRLPPAHRHRIVAMVEYPDGMLTFHELALVRSGEATGGEVRLSITDEQGTTWQYRTVATHFEDMVNWFIAYGSTEVWHVLNLTEDTHPFHVHLVQFQALSRDLYNKEGFQPETGGTTNTDSFQAHGTLDANEEGWKDTVRVNPGEMVTIAATFDGFTGRYMYHCHILEHEDTT